MNCHRITESMSDYLDDCLTGACLAEFEAHLETCECCRRELREVSEMLAAARCMGKCECPVDLCQSVRARLPEKQSRVHVWRRWGIRAVAVPIAAAAVAIALFFGWPAPVGEERGQVAVSAPEFNRYVGAHAGLQSRQVLNDPDVAFITAELEKAAFTGN